MRQRFDSVNGEVTLDFWRPISVAVINKYYLDLTTPNDQAHDVMIFSIGYLPLYSRWRVDFNTSYDYTPGVKVADKLQAIGTGVVVTRYLEDWAVSFGANFNQQRAGETAFTFNFTPPGVRRNTHQSTSFSPYGI